MYRALPGREEALEKSCKTKSFIFLDPLKEIFNDIFQKACKQKIFTSYGNLLGAGGRGRWPPPGLKIFVISFYTNGTKLATTHF